MDGNIQCNRISSRYFVTSILKNTLLFTEYFFLSLKKEDTSVSIVDVPVFEVLYPFAWYQKNA